MIGVRDDVARRGISKLLMRDAMLRVVSIADLAGTYALTLDALDEELVAYYCDQFGFQSFNEGNLADRRMLKEPVRGQG